MNINQQRIDQHLDQFDPPFAIDPQPLSAEDDELRWALDYSEWQSNQLPPLPADDEEAADFADFWLTAGDIRAGRRESQRQLRQLLALVGGAA